MEDRWRFDKAFSVFYYRDSLREAIHLFKYAGRVLMAASLAHFLYEYATPWLKTYQPDFIIPVPSRSTNLRRRGFNPPHYLAKHLQKKWGLPLFPDALICIKDIPSQAGLKRVERIRNVKGAFKGHPGRVKDRSILLVDDVFTTGATADECAKSLKKAGAKVVLVLTLARTVDWDIKFKT